MNGETNLSKLIKGMTPALNPGEYVFCTLSSVEIPSSLKPVCIFRETEGTTLVITKEEAITHHLNYSFVAAWITLTIHSALDAVGFTAAISQELAKADISCNIVAAYYHDHLFVPIAQHKKALDILKAMTM